MRKLFYTCGFNRTSRVGFGFLIGTNEYATSIDLIIFNWAFILTYFKRMKK